MESEMLICEECGKDAKGFSITLNKMTFCMKCFLEQNPELDPARRDDEVEQSHGDEPI